MKVSEGEEKGREVRAGERRREEVCGREWNTEWAGGLGVEEKGKRQRKEAYGELQRNPYHTGLLTHSNRHAFTPGCKGEEKREMWAYAKWCVVPEYTSIFLFFDLNTQ